MKRYQNVTVETVDEIEGFDEGYVAQAVKDVHAHLGEVEPSDVTYGSGMLLWGPGSRARRVDPRGIG